MVSGNKPDLPGSREIEGISSADLSQIKRHKKRKSNHNNVDDGENEGSVASKTDDLSNDKRKRFKSEDTDSGNSCDEDEKQRAERRAANNRSALKSRLRKKRLIEELQSSVTELSKERDELRNDISRMRGELDVYQRGNEMLRKQLLCSDQPSTYVAEVVKPISSFNPQSSDANANANTNNGTNPLAGVPFFANASMPKDNYSQANSIMDAMASIQNSIQNSITATQPSRDERAFNNVAIGMGQRLPDNFIFPNAAKQQQDLAVQAPYALSNQLQFASNGAWNGIGQGNALAAAAGGETSSTNNLQQNLQLQLIQSLLTGQGSLLR